MLWKATQQFSRFRDIIELISGVVFLATPHFTKSDEESAKALSTVLRTDLSLTSKQPFTKLNLSSLVNTSLHFEELRMQIPVLSGFETVETKLRSSFWVSRKAIVSNMHVCRTMPLLNNALARPSAAGRDFCSIRGGYSYRFGARKDIPSARLRLPSAIARIPTQSGNGGMGENRKGAQSAK